MSECLIYPIHSIVYKKWWLRMWMDYGKCEGRTVEHCVYLKDVKIDGFIDCAKRRPFHPFLCRKGLPLSPKWVQINAPE